MNELAPLIRKIKIKEYGYGDLEAMLLVAYERSLHYEFSPQFFDILNCFWEAFEESRLFNLYCVSLDYPFHKSELDEDILEKLLLMMGAEFVTMIGEPVNAAQNCLIKNWRSYEPVSYPDQLRLPEHSQQGRLSFI